LTLNFLPPARMDLLDWFFSFSTAHNFSFSNEVTLTLAFETITSHKFLRDTQSRGANPFTRQWTSNIFCFANGSSVTLCISSRSILKSTWPITLRKDSHVPYSTSTQTSSWAIFHLYIQLYINQLWERIRINLLILNYMFPSHSPPLCALLQPEFMPRSLEETRFCQKTKISPKNQSKKNRRERAGRGGAGRGRAGRGGRGGAPPVPCLQVTSSMQAAPRLFSPSPS
jgi:hypothetical protein